MTVGGCVAVQLAAVALPWTSFLVWASTRIPERPHTMFRLLNIFLASSVLGRTARTSHNGEPSLRQSLYTECTGKPWPQRSAWISSTGKSVGMPRITAFSLRSSSRAVQQLVPIL
ncbi:hypothetical protein EVAR_24325_1 [Eumeta japonica]|uniref:Uncharacterized protein n=1 Tax=Eumeta variegata TaxID=151549 RepID=A0A4C1VN67_EUMVA|nr:hypothetical protein EVAR_24325_1 [Eumeta japonica]